MPILCLAFVLALVLAPTPPAMRAAVDAWPGESSAAPGLVVDIASSASPRWGPPYLSAGPRWGPPLSDALVVRRAFEPPRHRWSPGHRGVDLAAPAGAAVHAAGSGTVVFAGTLAGRGVISIEHAPGVRTTYEPVAPTVIAGQRVRVGAMIGRLAPDRRHRDRLHWGMRIRDTYLDPMRLLRARAMLKPDRPPGPLARSGPITLVGVPAR